MKTIQITNGPSKEELFDGLRLVSEKRLVPFCFEREGGEGFAAVLIHSIAAEDSSGHSWNITFAIDKNLLEIIQQPIVIKKEAGVISHKISFQGVKNSIELQREGHIDCIIRAIMPKDAITLKAYYSSKLRTGVLTIIE